VKRALAIASLLLSACAGTETGNPPFAPSVSAETGVPMGIVPMASLDAAWLAIEDVELVPSCSAGDDGTIVTSGQVALDLAAARAVETEAVLEEGDYCAFRFERTAWADADPTALSGFTLAIDATVGPDTPVRIRSARTGSIALVADEPFAMTAEMGSLLVFVDESLLFSGVSFAGAAREADGSILISSEANSALLDRIEAQLAGALFLYRDTDGDGALSGPERDAGPIAIAR
jgi:hypothetical protein